VYDNAGGVHLTFVETKTQPAPLVGDQAAGLLAISINVTGATPAPLYLRMRIFPTDYNLFMTASFWLVASALHATSFALQVSAAETRCVRFNRVDRITSDALCAYILAANIAAPDCGLGSLSARDLCRLRSLVPALAAFLEKGGFTFADVDAAPLADAGQRPALKALLFMCIVARLKAAGVLSCEIGGVM